MKTVIHAWTQTAANLARTDKANYWGLGDLIRGTITLAEVCRNLGYRFVLDMRGHPLGRVFVTQEGLPDGIDYSKVDFFSFTDYVDIETYLRAKFDYTDVIALNTNGYGLWPTNISNETKLMLRQALTPNKRLAKMLDLLAPKDEYEILHFRFGDEAIAGVRSQKIIRALPILMQHKTPCTVLISDSAEFKRLASHLFDICVSNIQPVHTGLETNDQAIYDTICEFLLIANARSVKTFSVYSWVSGFVAGATSVFSVPLAQMRVEQTTVYRLRYTMIKLLLKLNVSWKRRNSGYGKSYIRIGTGLK